jgi:hypothetical protein
VSATARALRSGKRVFTLIVSQGLPASSRETAVRARSVLVAPGDARRVWLLAIGSWPLAVWLRLFLCFARRGRLGLCLLFFTELLVTGFPAVGDFGQELADMFDFFFGPGVVCSLACLQEAGGRDFFLLNVAGKGLEADSEFSRCFGGGVQIHYDMILSDSLDACQEN